MAGKKHLTLDERIIIETRLREKQSISSIAKELGKTVSTISREIKRGSTTFKTGSGISHSAFNNCKNRYG